MAKRNSTQIADSPISRNLASLAEAHGFSSWRALSEAAGTGDTYVREVIIGRVRNPSLDKLGAVAKVLGVSLEVIQDPGLCAAHLAALAEGGVPPRLPGRTEPSDPAQQIKAAVRALNEAVRNAVVSGAKVTLRIEGEGEAPQVNGEVTTPIV